MSLQDEMMIIMGGWRDARCQAIEEEVMGLLHRLGVKDQVHSVTVLYVRSSSARIMLHITEDLGLALARKKQMNIVTALKTMAPVSKKQAQMGLSCGPLPIGPRLKGQKLEQSSASRATLMTNSPRPIPMRSVLKLTGEGSCGWEVEPACGSL